MHDVDLNLLYTFRVFVDAGSLAETARRLGRSEPAISARLHRLQDTLDAELLELVGRRLVLTPAGRRLYESCVPLLDGVNDVVDIARASSAEPTGVLTVGALPTVGLYTVAPRLPEFLRAHPKVSVEMRYGLTREQLDDLSSGAMDVVLSVGRPPVDERMTVIGIRDVRPVLVGRRGQREALGSDPDELRGETFLEWGPMEDPFFDGVSEYLRRHGLDDNVRVRIGHIHTLKTLVAGGAGLCILPDYTVVEEELVTCPLDGLDATFVMWCAARTSAMESVTTSAFVQWLTSPE